MGITLCNVAGLLSRHKRTLLITFACVFVAAALLGLRWHSYRSHMVILLKSEAGSGLLGKREMLAEAELLKSDALLEQLAFANGLQNRRGSHWLSLAWPRLDVVARPGSNELEVSYRSADPAQSFALLNSLGRLFVQTHSTLYQAELTDAAAGLRAIEAAQARRVQQSGRAPDEAELARQAQTGEQEYLAYLSRREQQRIREGVSVEGAALLVAPAMPLEPTLGLAFILFLSATAALLLSLAAACTMETLPPSFHTPAQVMASLGVAVVVAVPKIAGLGKEWS